MPNSDVTVDHEGFEGAVDAAGEAMEGTRASGEVPNDGVDPLVLAAIEHDDERHNEDVDSGEEDTDEAKKASGELRDTTEEAAARVAAVDTDVDKGVTGVSSGGAAASPTGFSAGGDTPSGGGHTAGAGSTAGGANPSGGPSSATSPLTGGGRSTTPTLSQMGYQPASTPTQNPLTQGLSGLADGGAAPMITPPTMPVASQPATQYEWYEPTPATATQYDINNAPNKQQLADAIYDALNDEAAWGTGSPGDDRPRVAGSNPGSLGELSDDERDRKVQELMQDIVDQQIPYAWGGGHGAEPGPSQGISDGGGQADRMGDYSKTGVDCSGLARWIHYQISGNDNAAGTAETQYASGMAVSADEARPGDLFFPDSAGRPPHHVQVYAGNGMVIEAQQSGTNVMFSPLQSGEFRRF